MLYVSGCHMAVIFVNLPEPQLTIGGTARTLPNRVFNQTLLCRPY